MTSAMSSPGLGSASLMEWPGVITPDAKAPRLVQKQVVRIIATGSEALVVLYLRLTVRPSDISQTFQLFSDEGITLKSSHVYPVDMSKEGRAIFPPDASRHLQRAAEVLAMKRAPETSSSSSEGQGSSFRMRKAKITTSNYHVSFVVPPDAILLTSQKAEERCHYVAVVQLATPFTDPPPKWSYMVRIPVARCLNNFLIFSFDESCVLNDIIVEVDPPLLPKPNGIKSRAQDDNKAAEANGEADEDRRLSGPFYSTSSLCIRWASADTGISTEEAQDVGIDEDSDDSFARKNFRRIDEAGQTSQIDSLSGMIQEASVEVYTAAALQEDLLQSKGAKRVKTTHVIRSSWPTAPAPSSGISGILLPRIVFALPCNDDTELQILCASINGRSIHVEENAGSNARRSTSRIIDLKLPESFDKAAKLDLFLLYMQESSSISTLCLFPPVASSIADLTVTLHYGAFDSHLLPISFSNQPVNVCEDHMQGELSRVNSRAHMVPSMTSVSAVWTAKSEPVALTTTPSDNGPLRRTLNKKDKKRFRSFYPPSAGYLLHAVCTAILAIVLLGTIINLEPIGTLSRKVDSLAMALNVDFSEGSWKPESIPATQVLPNSTTSEVNEQDNTNLLDDLLPNGHPDEAHELSIDTPSFALLLRHLSLGLTETISWPIRFLLSIFRRT